MCFDDIDEKDTIIDSKAVQFIKDKFLNGIEDKSRIVSVKVVNLMDYNSVVTTFGDIVKILTKERTFDASINDKSDTNDN